MHDLLDGKVVQAVVDLVAEAATLRWSGGRAFAVRWNGRPCGPS